MYKLYAFYEGNVHRNQNMVVRSTLKLAQQAHRESERLNRRPFSIFEYYGEYSINAIR